MFARLRLTSSAAPTFIRYSASRPSLGRVQQQPSSNCSAYRYSWGTICNTSRLHARLYQRRLYSPQHHTLETSFISNLVLVAVLTGGAAVATYLYSSSGAKVVVPVRETQEEHSPAPLQLDLVMHPDAGPGHVGNLTEEQEAKLREFWTVTLKLFGIEGLDGAAGIDVTGATASIDTTTDDGASTVTSTPDKKKSKKRLGLFGSKKGKDSGAADDSASGMNVGLEDDKYGHTKDFQKTLSEFSPDELRTGFWSQIKIDNPDGLLLRFLRARKWDIDKALVMMIATMRWRVKEMKVDDEIIAYGEGGAVEEAHSSDKAAAKEADDFIRQIRLGKSVLHGVDKEGRPICQVRVRLHRAADQSVTSVEKYTVYTIETARLMLVPPVETAVSDSPIIWMIFMLPRPCF